MHDLSRCGYTDTGAGTPTTATLLQVKRRLVGYRADRRHAGLGLTSNPFLLVRIPRPVPRVYWPLVLGLRQAQRGRPTPLDVGAVPWPSAESTLSMARRRGSQLASRPGPGTGRPGTAVPASAPAAECGLAFSDGEYPTNLPRLMGAMAKERDWPTAPSRVNSHRSNGTLGVGPADSTGNLCPHTVREGPGLLRRECVGGRGSRGRSAAGRYLSVR